MRIPHTRDSYTPKGAVPVDCGDSDAAVFTYEANGVVFAIGFHGKVQKPDWHHRFRTEQSRADHIAKFVAGRQARAAMMAEVKANRYQPNRLEVGKRL